MHHAPANSRFVPGETPAVLRGGSPAPRAARRGAPAGPDGGRAPMRRMLAAAAIATGLVALWVLLQPLLA